MQFDPDAANIVQPMPAGLFLWSVVIAAWVANSFTPE